MDEPGGLHDLDDAGTAAWDAAVTRTVESVIPDGRHPFFLASPNERTPHSTGPDWTGLPARVVRCLGRARALELLDVDRRLQEEYLEWRTVRTRGGRIKRIELTTELRDYWRVLAAHKPAWAVELAGELTGRAVKPEHVFGVRVPDRLDPDARLKAFSKTMIVRRNPLNDGQSGICFMSHASNDLRSLVELAGAATMPCLICDPVRQHQRLATAAETIPLLGGAAVDGRGSDPVIVERLGRLAFERRLVALEDPIGVYVQGVESARLRTPDGSAVPVEWFVASRGLSAEDAADGRARHQRIVFEVPKSERFAVGDLIDVATEAPIRHGGQIAELIQLRVFFRVSEPGVVRSSARLDPKRRVRRPDPCRDVRAIAGASR